MVAGRNPVIGSVIDKYEVLQKLGEGATATVYRGRHISIGKDVAIKVLHPHLCASSRYRERFHREARAVGRLSHENIVSILDYSGQNAEDCYIVTELVDGMTLLALIDTHGAIPSEILASIGIELAEALSFAHKAGIIHRDIKPENVMVRRDGVVKLMDFGVARVLDEGQITLDGSLLGSPAYMSPQQAVDEKLDGRTDLFSLGTVLFHAVTGHVPFAGSNASIILRNIIDGQRAEVLELNPQAAPALAAVTDKLLQTRAEDRYPTADDVVTALHAVLTESGLTPEHPRINLRAWLVNPKETETLLVAHLQTDLLSRGKSRLAEGDTVGALQLFNRLLAMDENHTEVLALIQALHAPPASSTRIGRLAVIGAATLLLAGIAAWVAYPSADPGAHAAAKAKIEAPVVAPPAAPPVATLAVAPASTPVAATTTKPLPTPAAKATLPGSRPEPRPPAAAASAPLPGKVFLDLVQPADVWIDGQKKGEWRNAKGRQTWLGTQDNPILLDPGPHTLELKNPGAKLFTERFTIGPDESRRVSTELERLSSEYVVNSAMPRDCLLTVDNTKYGAVKDFGGRFEVPGATGHVIFDCPDKGRFEYDVTPKAGSLDYIPNPMPKELLP
ncbi:hypothetical protein LBMAG42_19860 [Deltaproteobacteria bacterium]|nr:hypothetical protein LBMAG42_19860 [Deltaproteobacteria bacterium]